MNFEKNLIEVIIVGSGPSALGALEAFIEKGIKPTILDVGFSPSKTLNSEDNFYDLKKREPISKELISNSTPQVIERTLLNQELSPKLTVPLMEYATRLPDFINIYPKNFKPIISYGRGGLAAAWGAGVYKLTKIDEHILPFSVNELEKYYKKLEKKIPITGGNDDLTRFFGKLNEESKAYTLPLSPKAKILRMNYIKKRKKLNEKGFYLGAPRLAVDINSLTNQDGKFKADELVNPEQKGVYNPFSTIEKYIKEGKVQYLSGIFVESFEEKNDYVIIRAKSVKDKRKLTLKTRYLILAAGTINTSAIVLRSRKDYKKELRLIDNPLIQFPLIFPKFISSKIDKYSFGMTQLNFIYENKKYNYIQGSIIELNFPIRSYFLSIFPLSMKANVQLVKYFLTSMLAVFAFLPVKESSSMAKLRLGAKDEIIIEFNSLIDYPRELNKVFSLFRSLGAFTTKFFSRIPLLGSGIHYAGTLPSRRKSDDPYSTDINGKLNKTKRIFIVDGSIIPALPSKNITFTLMANSYRIGDYISESIKNE